jgi:hypothetical protein
MNLNTNIENIQFVKFQKENKEQIQDCAIFSDNSNFIEINENPINNDLIVSQTTNIISNEEINIDNLKYKNQEISPSSFNFEHPPQFSFPKLIFIVPYRNREYEKKQFEIQMQKILALKYPPSYYKIFYIHQLDNRNFNRGAMKNIGFIMVKNKYPTKYKEITLVFNDVDTYPVNENTITDYSTTPNIVKHFYGYTHALGGIVSINALDFEKIQGFPNYFAWGFEDNELNERVLKNGMHIDRSVFYKIGDIKNIIQFNTEFLKTVNRGEFNRYVKRIDEGLHTIHKLKYSIDEESGMVNVSSFETNQIYNEKLNETCDTQKTNYPFKLGYSSKKRCSMNLII